MKNLKLIAISIILLVVLIAYANPLVSTSYKKIDANTVEKTVVTTYIKSELEVARDRIIEQRDSEIHFINLRYQPLIDEIDTKLELFK